MSDVNLENWIASLPSLDSSLPEDTLISNGRIAFERFNSLSSQDQQRVTQLANERLNITPERVASYKPDEKTTRVYSRITSEKAAPTPAPKPQEPPKSFEDAWTRAAAKSRGQQHDPNLSSAEVNRHGYQPTERRAQLERIASIQREAKQTGKTFSQVADERMSKGNWER